MIEQARIRSKQDFLGCVALPVLRRDLKSSLGDIFELWADARFTPISGHETFRPTLLVVLNRADRDDIIRVEDLYRQHPILEQSFSRLVVQSADLSGDRDLYARNSAEPMGEFGNKAGPNFLFQKTMEIGALFSQSGGFTLQIELDCLPVSSGWIEQTNDVIAVNSRAWVIGSIFAGPRGLDRSVQTHINGNALYKTGDPAFIHFLQTIWMPDLLSRAQRMPNLAYDCWWAIETQRANSSSGNAAWIRYQTYESFFRNDPMFVNLLGGVSELRDYVAIFQRFAAHQRKPVYFHGAAMGTVLTALLDHKTDTMFDAINRLTVGMPESELTARIVPILSGRVPIKSPASQIVVVSGFHEIDRRDPATGAADMVWTSSPTFVVALLKPESVVEVIFHGSFDLPPEFDIRNAGSGVAIPHSVSWDTFNQNGVIRLQTSERLDSSTDFMMVQVRIKQPANSEAISIPKGAGLRLTPGSRQKPELMDAFDYAALLVGPSEPADFPSRNRVEVAAE